MSKKTQILLERYENLIIITYYAATKNLIDVAFTKSAGERRVVLDRKDYDAWIARTDRNQFPFSYTDAEDRVVTTPCTVPMSDYWNTDEVTQEHHKDHLYDYLVMHNLHYDEELDKWNGKPHTDKAPARPAEPFYPSCKDRALAEREAAAGNMENAERMYFAVYDSVEVPPTMTSDAPGSYSSPIKTA